MLHCQNGRRDSLTIRARIVDPSEGLDAQGTVTVASGKAVFAGTAPGSVSPSSAWMALSCCRK